MSQVHSVESVEGEAARPPPKIVYNHIEPLRGSASDAVVSFVWKKKDFVVVVKDECLYFPDDQNELDSETTKKIPFNAVKPFPAFVDQLYGGLYGDDREIKPPQIDYGGPLMEVTRTLGIDIGFFIDGIVWLLVQGFIFPTKYKYFLDGHTISCNNMVLYRWRADWHNSGSIPVEEEFKRIKPREKPKNLSYDEKQDRKLDRNADASFLIYRNAFIATYCWNKDLHQTWCSHEFKVRVWTLLLAFKRMEKVCSTKKNQLRMPHDIRRVIVECLASIDDTCVTAHCEFNGRLWDHKTRRWGR
jgi:hypothetical protein